MKSLPVGMPYVGLVNATTKDSICAEAKPWDAADFVVLALFTILVGFCLFGTALDFARRYFYRPNALMTQGMPQSDNASSASLVSSGVETTRKPPAPDKFQQILLAFSWVTNLEKLFDTTVRPGTMRCLQGIRFFSMTWIVLGHTLNFIPGNVSNILDFLKAQNRISMQPVVTMSLAVDTFLVLSALLVSYQTAANMSKNTINWAHFYFHRFWRLTPVYLMLILLACTLYLHLPEGPMVRTVDASRPGCINYGWTNILYINNLYPEYNGMGCVGWTWYLA